MAKAKAVVRARAGTRGGKPAHGQSVTGGQAARATNGHGGGGGDWGIYLLDVGPQQYGDSIVCRFGETTVLIDGAHAANVKASGDHPSIPDQIAGVLNQTADAIHVSLLIVSHAHADHIGCLPALVQSGALTADWVLAVEPNIGFGKDGTTTDAADPDVRRLAAALREEPRDPGLSDAELDEFLTDAATSFDKYVTMLDTLEKKGATVVRYGRDETAKLEKEFAPVGLKILGPTDSQLLLCAKMIAAKNRDVAGIAHAAVANATDSASRDPVGIYRRIISRPRTDVLIDNFIMKDKGCINDQSIVTRFEYAGIKTLFAGDMQLAQPEVSDQSVVESIAALVETIKDDGPYDFAKLCHHGSYNGFDGGILTALGNPKILGICSGTEDKSHPNPETLQLLEQHASSLEWVRTDKNRQCAILPGPNGALVAQVKDGDVNDAAPPGAGDSTAIVKLPPPPMPAPARPVSPIKGGPVMTPPPAIAALDGSTVEIVTRVPASVGSVSFTLAIGPNGTNGANGKHRGASGPFDGGPLKLGAGRKLPSLLFVTSRDALARNVGKDTADSVLDGLRAGGHVVLDTLPANVSFGEAVDVVRAATRASPPAGVVLIGGYDVVPSGRLDVLPDTLAATLGANRADDDDHFIVWNDDAYGDTNGDIWPEIPVSRVPDAGSPALLVQALQPSATSNAHAFGVRNVARPFAAQIYQKLPAPTLPMPASRTAKAADFSRGSLDADRLYLMLHGSAEDGRSFWGETAEGMLEAVNVSNLSGWNGRVVFAGCCWGGLIAQAPAVAADPSAPVAPRGQDGSFALSALGLGAQAFIGCTGSHYSPNQPPYQSFGGPLHDAFWAAERTGKSPAAALLAAKQSYRAALPHGQTTPASIGAEYKTLWQFTCLGLGW